MGNIAHVVSATYTVLHEYSYDAWGRMRNPTNWTNFDPGSEPVLFSGRGFTSHEHLPWFNLINMNGRAYDPLAGQFLSPDPLIQDPLSTQHFNRYSYCVNNPLSSIDPSGYQDQAIIGDDGIIRSIWKFIVDLVGGNTCPKINNDHKTDNSVSLGTAVNRSKDHGGNGYNSSSAQGPVFGYFYGSGVGIRYESTYSNSNSKIITGGGRGDRVSEISSTNSPSVNYEPDAGGQVVQGGQVASGGGGFNEDKAISYLKNNFILPYGAGQCINHMVSALIEGGITGLKGNQIKAACLYGPILKDLGFVTVNRSNTYYKGDIAIIQGYDGGTYCKGSGVVCGHIQMYDGIQWLSDFPQSRPFWPGKGYADATPSPSFEILHWPGN